MWRRIRYGCLIISAGCRRAKKEAVVAYFRVLSRKLRIWTEENCENLKSRYFVLCFTRFWEVRNMNLGLCTVVVFLRPPTLILKMEETCSSEKLVEFRLTPLWESEIIPLSLGCYQITVSIRLTQEANGLHIQGREQTYTDGIELKVT
jgi:hypothetical protein